MNRASLSGVGELIPHARADAAAGPRARARAGARRVHGDPAASELFRDAAGRVPAWVGLEYLAQCMAVYGSLVARAEGTAARFGPFIGGRRLQLRVDAFPARSQVLRVTVRHLRGERGLVAFDGRIQAGAAASRWSRDASTSTARTPGRADDGAGERA